MIRIKSYIKWLSERGYTKNLFPSDVPINKTILQSPTYLTKDELKLVFDMLNKQVEVAILPNIKRDYTYAVLQTRAIVHMLYAT
jgi:site-specific recombinase XerD